MQRRDFRMPRDPRDKTTPFPTVSIVREREPGLSSTVKLLIGGGILLALVGGRAMMGGSEPERPKPAPRRVVAPAATAAAPAPIVQPAPAATAPAAPIKEPKAEPRGLAMGDANRLREAALEDLQRFEKTGRYQEALDALDEAEQNGASKSQLEATRVRLRALAAEAKKLEDAFAASDQALSSGEYDAALKALRSVEEQAKKTDRLADIEDRVKTINTARERAKKLVAGAKAIAHAEELLDASDLVGARAEVETARGLIAGSPDVTRVETRLHDLERLPAGFTYVVVAPERGLYVRKKPVSNAEFKKWIDETGRSGAAPWKNGFTPSESDSAVRGVFLDAARNFAASRGERLPADDEWVAIKKTLRLTEETKPQAGVFANGFYTVKAP